MTAEAETMLITYRYRIKDKRAAKRLSAMAIGANQIWNYCNAFQKDLERRYRAGGPKRRWPSHFDYTGLTTGVTKDLGIHADTVSAVCRAFAVARNTHKHSLRFRASFGARRSLGWVPFYGRSRRLDGNDVILLGRRYRVFGSKRRPIPATAKGGAFVEDSRGRWYICLQVEVRKRATSATGEVGIDLGLKTLATCSDGAKIERRRVLETYAERLATAQRAGNSQRAKAIHAKIANVRNDFLHKATTALVRENRLIVVGNVSSSKLAKTRMAKSVLDASWTTFRSQLSYKCQQAGAVFIEADERNTSRMCSACGVIPDSSPKGMGALGIRAWRCDDCGTDHDRDQNAAINILALGRAVAARADESRRVVQ